MEPDFSWSTGKGEGTMDTRSNGHEFHQGKLQLDIKKKKLYYMKGSQILAQGSDFRVSKLGDVQSLTELSNLT